MIGFLGIVETRHALSLNLKSLKFTNNYELHTFHVPVQLFFKFRSFKNGGNYFL